MIREFFEKKKEKESKKKKKSASEIEGMFTLENWLPRAALRAKERTWSTHPGKFTHSSIKEITSVVYTDQRKDDGFLKSGNVDCETDSFGNAAALDVDQFLRLKMKDGNTLLRHIEERTSLSKNLLKISTESYDSLREKFLTIKNYSNDIHITDSKIKQVYFPVGEGEYHQLSVLTPSGVVFEMKKRIDEKRFFSDDSKEAKEARSKNQYSKKNFFDFFGLVTVGYGGTKPQNISVLNSNNSGKSYLLPSVPPVLKMRNISLPRYDFFIESLWFGGNCWEDHFEYLDKQFQDKRNNQEIRAKIGRIIIGIFYEIMGFVKKIRRVESDNWSLRKNYEKLPTYQKVILDKGRTSECSESDKRKFIKDSARWVVRRYNKGVGKKSGINLSDTEMRSFYEVIKNENWEWEEDI